MSHRLRIISSSRRIDCIGETLVGLKRTCCTEQILKKFEDVADDSNQQVKQRVSDQRTFTRSATAACLVSSISDFFFSLFLVFFFVFGLFVCLFLQFRPVCADGAHLWRGRCLSECPASSYLPVNETSHCLACHYSCRTCVGSSDAECTGCHADAQLRSPSPSSSSTGR